MARAYGSSAHLLSMCIVHRCALHRIGISACIGRGKLAEHALELGGIKEVQAAGITCRG